LDSPPLLNIQNHVIPAGAAAVVDTTFEAPGDFLLVDHSLGRTFNKGCVGIVEAAGPAQPDVFKFVSKETYEDVATTSAPKIALSDGQKAALGQCKTCHDLTPARRHIVGPALYGVYGKKPSIGEVPFTQWDKAALNEFLRDPSQVKRNTPMTYRVRDDQKRAEIIQALEALN
jgi:cytochrome c2